MESAAEALAAHSRRLLALLQSGAEVEALAPLLDARAELIRALRGDEPVPAALIQEIRQLDQQLIEAVAHRRTAALAALQRRQRGRGAYRLASHPTPRFVDRSG